jgi:hypothetical protein
MISDLLFAEYPLLALTGIKLAKNPVLGNLPFLDSLANPSVPINRDGEGAPFCGSEGAPTKGQFDCIASTR